MSHPTESLTGPSLQPEVLILLIVARDQPEVYPSLQRRLRQRPAVATLLDRREGERRQVVQPVLVDRRRGDRRSALSPRTDLRQRKYIFARPQVRCPHD
jgi:hypothetical protein